MAVIQHFTMDQTAELRDFLFRAQRLGYGGEHLRGAKVMILENAPVSDIGGGVQTETQYECGLIERTRSDGASELLYCSPDERFVYVDKWYGGEPFAGMTTVTYKGVICFAMTYHGKVMKGINREKIYAFLKAALARINPEYPWRGPDWYANTVNEHDEFDMPLEYRNDWGGDLAGFSGKETICWWNTENSEWVKSGVAVYEMYYRGGLVNI